MRRLTVWGLMTFALAVALVAPGAASATTCTPSPASPIVRFDTTLGNIDVQLNGTDAPCTVQNFESYMSSGAYNASFFHRSVASPDVIQGGGYTYDTTTKKPVAITQKAAITNEYKDPNIAGSLAMAMPPAEIQGEGCTSGVYNTATDEWFFNVANNSSGLDQDCFTVFGQALDPASIAVINKIAAAQVCSLSTQWDDTAAVFATVPTIGYAAGACAGTSAPKAPPTAATSANLIFVNSIKLLNDTTPPAITITSPARHQTLNLGQKVTPSYSCNDGTGTGVDTCTGPSTVNTNLYGTLQYTVSATDYAGNTDTKTITYLVELPPTLQSLGTVSNKGVVSLKLHCPSSVACVGSAGLVAGKPALIIGGTGFYVRPGGTGLVRLPLTGTGWRMFRAAKWRLGATLAIVPSGAGSKSITRKVTLTKAKPKPKKHKKK